MPLAALTSTLSHARCCASGLGGVMRATATRHARSVSLLIVCALLLNVLLPLFTVGTAHAAPTLSLPSGTLNYPANSNPVPTAVVIDGALTVNSAANITSVTIKVDTNYQKGADVL